MHPRTPLSRQSLIYSSQSLSQSDRALGQFCPNSSFYSQSYFSIHSTISLFVFRPPSLCHISRPPALSPSRRRRSPFLVSERCCVVGL
ncbi:hypothetical protein AAHA92_16608 [Salvia divinorum]|uniref:Uncharacterized protein n=1 Tax=Salvia divinorum TaxID=28513 RepID=A0ABD1H037_SALDI